MICKEKVWYPTAELASEALAAILAKRKHDPRLRVYRCHFGLFYLGHRRKVEKATPVITKAEPSKATPPTVGQLRRRLERITKAMDRQRAYRVRLLDAIVKADLQALELERQMLIEQRRVADMFLSSSTQTP